MDRAEVCFTSENMTKLNADASVVPLYWHFNTHFILDGW